MAKLRRKRWAYGPFQLPVITASGVTLAVAVVLFYPFDSEHYQWHPIDSVVQKVVAQYVVTPPLSNGVIYSFMQYEFWINGTLYPIDNELRAEAVPRPGDSIHLDCARTMKRAGGLAQRRVRRPQMDQLRSSPIVVVPDALAGDGRS